jgi:hypothetical protein
MEDRMKTKLYLIIILMLMPQIAFAEMSANNDAWYIKSCNFLNIRSSGENNNYEITAEEFSKLLIKAERDNNIIINYDLTESPFLKRLDLAENLSKRIYFLNNTKCMLKTTVFTDVSVEMWENGINILEEAGIILGDDNKKFRPYDNVTYAEANLVIYRYVNYIISNSKIEERRKNGLNICNRQLFIHNNTLYYIIGSELYSSDLNGKNAKILSTVDNYSHSLYVDDEFVYYCGVYNYIYRLNKISGAVECIVDKAQVLSFVVDNNSIYYFDADYGERPGSILKYNIITKERYEIALGTLKDHLFINGNWIYYQDKNNNLCKTHLDTGRTLILETKNALNMGFDIVDDEIYFVCENSIMRTNLNFDGIELLVKIDSSFSGVELNINLENPYIRGEWIYFADYKISLKNYNIEKSIQNHNILLKYYDFGSLYDEYLFNYEESQFYVIHNYTSRIYSIDYETGIETNISPGI